MRTYDQISQHIRLDAEHAKALKHLGLATILDLLYHLPVRYEDISAIQSVDTLAKGQDAVVYGKISGLKSRKSWKSRKPIAEGYVEDGTAKMKIIWFNQPYLARMLRDGAYVKLAGKVAGTVEKPYLANPEVEVVPVPILSLPTFWSDSSPCPMLPKGNFRQRDGQHRHWDAHSNLSRDRRYYLQVVLPHHPKTFSWWHSRCT